MELFRTFKRYEDAGAMSVEIECVAEDALNLMNDKTSIVTFFLRLRQRRGCDLPVHDRYLRGGAYSRPKHAHTFRDLSHCMINYICRAGQSPCIFMHFGAELLDKPRTSPTIWPQISAQNVFMHAFLLDL